LCFLALPCKSSVRHSADNSPFQPIPATTTRARSTMPSSTSTPALIVRCTVSPTSSPRSTSRAKNNLTALLHGAGHNLARIPLYDGVVVDLSFIKSVHVNPAARTLRVGGGATWRDVNHELQVLGLAATGGGVGPAGVGRLTLGEGFGGIVRKRGLARGIGGQVETPHVAVALGRPLGVRALSPFPGQAPTHEERLGRWKVAEKGMRAMVAN